VFSFLNKFKYLDVPLLAATFLLVLSGAAILYATTLPGDSKSIFYRQIAFLGAGLLAFLFLSFFDYHRLAKLNRAIYVFCVLVLTYLLAFGTLVHGGKRWLNIAFLGFQPAELAKFAVILGLARLLYLKRGEINSFGTFLWSFVYALIPAILVAVEPDLGSAIIILSIWVGIILLSPIKKKFLVVLFLALTLMAGGVWKFYLKDFQKGRIQIFLNPSLDPKGRGYNVRQATISVGSGQLLGRGLGKGVQSQQKFLPERQTDFIFAAAGEEIGFFGCISLICLYFFLCLRLLQILRNAKDDLGMYIAGGVFFFFFFHVVINIGMNIGILPVTGIPLPFVSAGGSSLVVCFMCLGVAQNVSLQSKALRF
jgi:rod shape determining protein RodA